MSATITDLIIAACLFMLFLMQILGTRRRIRIDQRSEVTVVLLWAICKKLGLDEALSGEKSTKEAVSDALEHLDGGDEEELPEDDECDED